MDHISRLSNTETYTEESRQYRVSVFQLQLAFDHKDKFSQIPATICNFHNSQDDKWKYNDDCHSSKEDYKSYHTNIS